MKQAILLLVHKNIGQVRKLIAYFEGQCEIYIHVDKGASISTSEKRLLEQLPGVMLVCSKYEVHWAGFSILKAELYLLRMALKLGNAGYFHLLSGQDYPLHPLAEFLHFFSHTSALGYINCQHLPCQATDSNTYYRLQYYVLSDYIDTKSAEGRKKVWDIVEWQRKHGIKRRIPDYVEHLYGGSAWFSIHRDVAQYLIDYTCKHPAFFRRMRFTYIPEEIYVSSVILNSPYQHRIVSNNNCRTILWNYEAIDCSPKNIYITDFRELLANPIGFFSRKFEMPESQAVMEAIDRSLLHRNLLTVMENGGWNTLDIYSYDYDIGLSNGLISFCREFGIRTVCDFGCGPGWYVANLRAKGISAIGYDINPNTRDLSDLINGVPNVNCCGIADLTQEVRAANKFDLVLFLSVGQYIPGKYESVVIENLKRNALRFVVISWAAEKHQGEYYVNRQDEKTLINRMCSDGSFIYNEIASSYLRKSCQLSFYQETLLIFQKV